MKTGIYILLFSILLFQFGGLSLVYSLKQMTIKLEMAHRIKTDICNLRTLVIPRHDFVASKINADEMFWHGNMYDIKSEQIVGDSISLEVLLDNKETNIYYSLKKTLRNAEGKHTNLPAKIIELTATFYILPSNTFEINCVESHINHNQYFLSIIHQVDLCKLYPPPKYCNV